jgi:malonyl-CoA decarboxylase
MSEIKKGFWETMSQGISEFGDRMRAAPKDPEIEAEELLCKALACLDGRRTLHARQTEAASLAQALRASKSRPEHLKEMLGALSVGLGAERKRVETALAAIDWNDVDMAKIEQDLVGAIGARRRELCQLWLSMDGALEFLVWLREEVLAGHKSDQALGPLSRDLDDVMGEVFAQGLLQMRPITWRSPALVLEKIMSYEQVHEMRLWGGLKSRLDKDRRVYALFHSGWEDEPLAFLEVALTRGLAKSVEEILGQNPHGLEVDVSKMDTATFYSINAPHLGLKGISFGEDLIRKSVNALRKEMPHIKTFCTLSPIPGFSKWLAGLGHARVEELCGTDLVERLAKKMGPDFHKQLVADLSKPGWISTALAEASKEVLEKLCVKYLALSPEKAGRLDPVARFHLGNGARVEALRHLADLSEKGLSQSYGMMVNYVYDLAELEKNKISERGGSMSASWSVRRLAKA